MLFYFHGRFLKRSLAQNKKPGILRVKPFCNISLVLLNFLVALKNAEQSYDLKFIAKDYSKRFQFFF
jgi:hypothetical protein